MITRRMPVARAHANVTRSISWFLPLALAVACSGSEDIDFFEPSDETGGNATGGTSGTDTGGTDTGGTSTGGTSGTGTGGAGSEMTGGTSGTDTGGTTTGGTDTGGMSSGGTAQGGDAGGGAGPMGGTAGDAVGGSAGTDTGGAGMGGSGGMGGAGTGGAGMGGAGMGGAAGTGGCVPTVPSTERCDGVDNNCMGGIDEGAACPDNCTGATRGGHYYILCSFEDASGAGTRLRTWPQALNFCQTRNLDLVFIESAEENAFLLDWVTKLELEDSVWMGANDRDPAIGQTNEGTWIWGSANNAVQFWDGDENGAPVMNRYQNWAGGEPNNQGNEDCGVLSFDHTWLWDDRICTNTYPNFVCESTTSLTPN